MSRARIIAFDGSTALRPQRTRSLPDRRGVTPWPIVALNTRTTPACGYAILILLLLFYYVDKRDTKRTAVNVVPRAGKTLLLLLSPLRSPRYFGMVISRAGAKTDFPSRIDRALRTPRTRDYINIFRPSRFTVRDNVVPSRTAFRFFRTNNNAA